MRVLTVLVAFLVALVFSAPQATSAEKRCHSVNHGKAHHHKRHHPKLTKREVRKLNHRHAPRHHHHCHKVAQPEPEPEPPKLDTRITDCPPGSVAGQAEVTMHVETTPARMGYEWTSYDVLPDGDPQVTLPWRSQNPGAPFTVVNSGGSVAPGIEYTAMVQAVDGKRHDPTPARCTMLVRPDGTD